VPQGTEKEARRNAADAAAEDGYIHGGLRNDREKLGKEKRARPADVCVTGAEAAAGRDPTPAAI
jgi:hypothetical protein